MIARIWHGYTSFENAEAYENLLNGTIFPIIAKKQVPGYRKIELIKRKLEGEFEFITIMWFDNLEAVKAFAGADYETAFVLPEADRLLMRFDAKSQHYEVAVSLSY